MEIFSRNKKIEDLNLRVNALERMYKDLDLEWSSAYDKLRSIVARMAKRASRIDASDGAPEAESPAGFQEGTPPSVPSSLSNRLNPRQQALQQKIMARRAGQREQ